MKKKNKSMIGWRELVDLPEWRIKGLRAKIDTGAYTSALHVEDIKELPQQRIEFHVILNKAKASKKVVARRVKKANVKSSIGVKTSRWFVETKVRLGGLTKRIPINLVDRGDMNFRFLVGRNAVKGNFTVDPGRSFLLSPTKKRRKRILKK